MLNWFSYDVFSSFKNTFKFSWILFNKGIRIDNENFSTIGLSISKNPIKLIIIISFVSNSDVFNLFM